ncbi:sodium:proton antiporter [Phocaeicola plebeius]|uniref:Sodium:proton antiporter n=1 Tax=Phocaeicola plebeius TaxID=310297 RepID=A0A415J5M9_9BACT|nr:sodium:proton antiporter [Phocaeicola plebeius]RHK96987.1 sodium:proton antiporter [Phocaeicola plebeius]RHL15351.1 sodium:proton antiporter [Phocaeicola plebeius]
MEEYTFLAPLLLTIGGLIIGAILKSLLKHSRLPYTVGLFAIGIILGVMNRTGVFQSLPELHDAVSSVANINPDLILYLFLPILIFDAAYELNLHIFKKTLANATLLAAPGLIICMLLTGALMMGVATFIPGFESWTWAFALMFGALISATDPVAVVALLHELKTSKRFSTLVDAESLLNDGTGIVCFMLFFGAYAAEEATHASPVITFIREVGLSTLLGFLLARIVIWFITRINSEEMVQNSVIILAAYLTFILSQYYLGVSGVIALVAFGLTVTYVGKPRLKPQVNTFMEHFWELLTYIANTLIFILVGVVIAEKVDFSWGALGVLILIYIALNFIRFAMIMLLYPVMKRLGYGLTRRESVILTWGGLRGALAMTLALMVSYTPAIPEDIRSQVLFFTAGIVTLTLCINATTMRALLNRLGLTHVPSARTMLAYRIEKSIRENSEKYLEGLKKRDALEGANWHKVESYMTAQPQEPAKNPQNKAMLPEIRLRVLDKEKAICREIYEEGVISKPVFLRLMNSLDELYDHDGNYPLNVRTSIFKFCQRTDLLNTLRNIPYLQNWMTFYFRERITVVYDLGRGFIILQKGSLKLLEDLRASEWMTGEQDSVLDTLREEINDNINRMSAFINNLADNFPKAYGHALTIKSIRMLLSNERRTVKQLINNGMLSEKDAERILDDIDERTDEINSFSHTFTASFLRWLFFIKKKKIYRN